MITRLKSITYSERNDGNGVVKAWSGNKLAGKINLIDNIWRFSIAEIDGICHNWYSCDTEIKTKEDAKTQFEDYLAGYLESFCQSEIRRCLHPGEIDLSILNEKQKEEEV